MPIYFVHGALCYSSLFKFFICLALPFKRVKLTSESVHVTQWSLWPKGVSGQAAETHMQTVTGESSGKSQPPQQPTKKKVLTEPDAIKAKDIGPRKRKLSVSTTKVNKPHRQKKYIPYPCDQRPRLLNVSFCWKRRLQFERGHCLRAVLIRPTINTQLVQQPLVCHQKVLFTCTNWNPAMRKSLKSTNKLLAATVDTVSIWLPCAET